MIWLDSHLSPKLASWLREEKGVEAEPLRDLGLREADDKVIFEKARGQQVTVLTKDRDFVDLVLRHGPPPQVIWLRCGNTSEARMRIILDKHLDQTLTFLNNGEALVEIQA